MCLVLSGRKDVENMGSMSRKKLEPILTKQNMVQDMRSTDEGARGQEGGRDKKASRSR